MPTLSLPKKQASNPFSFWIGKRVVIQRGVVTYSGTLSAVTSGWLILTNATVTGTKREASVETVWVDRGNLSHIHAEVEAHAVAADGTGAR